MSRPLVAALLLVPLSASAAGQGGGFTAGDLYLLSPAIQGSSSDDGALVHVDLSAGSAGILVDTFTTPSQSFAVAFDPWRQRVVFRAGLDTVFEPTHLWAVDAAGNLDDLGFAGSVLSQFAPDGQGRIYMRQSSATTPFVYLDASGELNVLLDASGTQPFLLNGSGSTDMRGLIYDPGTHALFVASIGPLGACPGGATDKVNVRRLPLSADGTRVVGPEDCVSFEVSSTGENPVGWSHGPGGLLVLVIDTNTNAQEPRLQTVDPVTLAVSPFASNGSYLGAAATNAGTWCSALGQVVILDTGTDVLRAFGAGQTGAGNVLALTGSVSAAGSSGETVSLLQVPPSACAGGWGPYGAGLAGAGALVPRLVGSGCPQVAGAFTLSVDRGVGGAAGLLFVGLSPAAVPFKGGAFLVGGVLLQLPLALGGAPGVAGAGSLLVPAGLPADPLLQGLQIFLQAGLNDAAAVQGVSLSKGLRIEIG